MNNTVTKRDHGRDAATPSALFNNTNMVLVIRRELQMALKPKSFTINSILADSECAKDDDSDDSDLDVTGDDTPPLDCSQKATGSKDNEDTNDGKSQTIHSEREYLFIR